MSDEVRSSSGSTPPEPQASPSDTVVGPAALEVDIPTPDLDLDSAPDSATQPNVAALPARDAATPRPPAEPASPLPSPHLPSPPPPAPPRSERPPSPSQRAAQL